MTNTKIETGYIVRDAAGTSYIVKAISGDGTVHLRGLSGVATVHFKHFHETYTVVC